MILIVSNGYGEDLVGASIASELMSTADGYDVAAFPLVGPGEPYRHQGVKTVDLPQLMPSGGFARTSLRSLLVDLRAGLVGCLLRQIREMRRLSGQVTLTICVGDVFLLWTCALGHLPRRVLVATAKSEFISGHLRVEAYLMRKLAEVVATRDRPTAESLRRNGVRTLYFGNFLMDVIHKSAESLPCVMDGRLVCLLPGSRSDFAVNLHDMLRCLEALPGVDGISFAVALARAPDRSVMAGALPNEAWSYVQRQEDAGLGYVGDLVLSRAPDRAALSIAVVAGRFGDLVASCDLVIGMAGTAVEQAVGLGKPAVTFPGRGVQFTKGFARAQKRLLGDAVSLVESSDPGDVAKEIDHILSNPGRYSQMSQAGIARMGQPGAVTRLVEYVRSMDGAVDGA